jgi:tRNA(Arg) A34 adenosine deaminase TadA
MSILEPNILMRHCIELAKQSHQEGQYAIAAIVADENGKVIAESGSTLRQGYDPTNHPEIAVIRMACESQKSRFLPGCYLFTTLEPCPMCASAAIWAKMKGIVFGAYQEDAINYTTSFSHSFSWRQISVKAYTIVDHGIPKLELIQGVLRQECVDLFYL